MIKWMNVTLPNSTKKSRKLFFALGILEDSGDSCSPEGVESPEVKSWIPCDVRDPDYSLWPEIIILLSLDRRAEIKLFLKIWE